MKIEDAPMDGVASFGWIVDPEGIRIPCMRFHEEGKHEDEDFIVPLDVEAVFAMISKLSEIYLSLRAKEEPPFEDDDPGVCDWPICLTGEQGALLAEEIRQEDLTGKPCTIYTDKYPKPQYEICGCKSSKQYEQHRGQQK